MDSEANSTGLREVRGFRCGGAGDTATTGGVKGSRAAERGGCNGEGIGRCSSGREVADALPQKKSDRVASHREACRPTRDQQAGVDVYSGGGKRGPIAERFDLVPPKALRLVAQAMAEGAARYGDLNWKGLPASNLLNHAMRHLVRYMEGDRSEPHLSHAAANLLMLTEMEEDGE